MWLFPRLLGPFLSPPPLEMDPWKFHISTDPGFCAVIRRNLAHLVQKEGTEKEQQEFLHQLARRECKRMIDWLTVRMPAEGTIRNLFSQLIVTISAALESQSHASQQIFQTYDATAQSEIEARQKKRDKSKGNFWLKVPWRNNELQIIGLHTVLNSPEVQSLYPISNEKDRVKVSYNLAVPNGVLMQNYGNVAESLELEEQNPPDIPAPHECVCKKYQSDDAINFHGHVATVDPGFIKDRRLRSYWLKGRKFRCQAHPQNLISSFEESLDKFITQACRRNRTEEDIFSPWKTKLLNFFSEKCNVLFQDADSPHHCFLSKEGMDELKGIQRDMVITYADKSAHDFVLCCKSVYKRLLWEEMHSTHYEEIKTDNSEIWQEHAALSAVVGFPPVNAHRYLYGILKMHKNPVGVRWIAGNHLQDLDNKKKIPACSLSSAEMVLGGVLRMCMHNLERKDDKCRAKGYKRYWVVTNVDRVAADIKHNVDALKGQKVFTRDFTRMYTSIPQERLVEKVTCAIREVFEWHSTKTKVPLDQLRVNVSFPTPGHAQACFAQTGFSFQEIINILSKVCVQVYFQQKKSDSEMDTGETTQKVRRQKQGLPMGGKASAELANLYCYAVESQFIDGLLQQGKLEEAKSWFYTWRYIDDLLGFGERNDGWKAIEYGMEHLETTNIRFSATDKKSQAVFWGMKIQSNPDGVWLSVQPKGEGWTWLPRRFIEYSSCHTHYTKWYMFKGLLIRALTICNTQKDFFQAAVHYAQGLVARGFPASSLKKAWRKFSYEKLNHPSARRNLTKEFNEWLAKQDFSHTHIDEIAERQQRLEKAKGRFSGVLLCGLTAANNIFLHRKVSPISRGEMEKKAEEMAEKEVALLYSCAPGTVLDLAADPRGNYAVDVLLSIINEHTAMKFQRWTEKEDIFSSTLLVGCGQHWQAVLKDDREGKWYVYEERTKTSIQNLAHFLRNKLKHGAVYQFLDNADTPPVPPERLQRKRPYANLSPPLHPGKRQSPMQDFRLSVTPKRSAPTILMPLPPAQPLPPEFHAATFEMPTGVGNVLPPLFVDKPPPDEVGDDSQTAQLLLDVQATGVVDDDATPKLDPEPPDDDMTVDDDGEEQQKERPKRNTSRPQLYQSDEVDRMEKEKRKTGPP